MLNLDQATGKLTELETVADGKSPDYLEIPPTGKNLYAVYDEGATPSPEREGAVMAYQINPKTVLYPPS